MSNPGTHAGGGLPSHRDAVDRRTIAVFGASSVETGSRDWETARRCGELLAQNGFTVATGGYGGAMAAASAGAAGAGGHVVGVTAPTVFPGRSGANAYVTEERAFPSLTERIHDIVSGSDGAITLPGSLGTFTELMVAWNVAFVARFNGSIPKPVITVGPEWRALVTHVSETLATDSSLVTCVDTVDDAVAVLLG